MPKSSGEYALSQKLTGFYAEIAAQNRAFITQARFYSMFNSFRASSSGALPLEYGNVNLNILPAWVFQLYKLALFLISLVVFFVFFLFAWNGIKQGWQFNFTLLTAFLIVFSFWGINFVFITTIDANCYKFPAEPFILGLFVYYAVQAVNWILKKKLFKNVC
jgi:hypothetical protein